MLMFFVIIGSSVLLIIQICLCILLKKYKLPYLLPGLWFLMVLGISFLRLELICRGVPNDIADVKEIELDVQWLPTLKPVLINAAIAVIPFLITTFWRGIKRNETTSE